MARRRTVSRLLALVLSAAALVGIPSPSAGLSPVSVQQAAPAASGTATGLHALVPGHGAGVTIRVLVELDVATHPAMVRHRRDRLAAAQERVVAALSDPAAPAPHRYQHLPYLAVEVAPEELAVLAATPGVVSIVEDEVWAPMLDRTVELLGADRAHAVGIDGGGSAVAVLDSGVDADHPFLTGRVVGEACFSDPGSHGDPLCPDGGTSQFGPGAGAPCEGATGCDHGTHVAGIVAGAAAVGPGPGIAPGADIVAVQVSHRTPTGDTAVMLSDVLRGLEWVYEEHDVHGIVAVNLSLGGGSYQVACDRNPARGAIELLRSVGIATVAAVGNDGLTDAISAPACLSAAVAVGASTIDDEVAPFSNGHPELLDLVAPGVSIASSVPGGGYALASGTSASAPHVAGAFALLRQFDPDASVEVLLERLRDSGVPVTDRRVTTAPSYPRLDVGDLLVPSLVVDGVCLRAPFQDVGVAHAFCAEIARGAEAGILRGWDDGTFRPNAQVTRQAAVAFLYERADAPIGAPDPGFVDVPASHPFHAAIAWAAEQGVTTGFGDGTFRPREPVTRQAAVAFLHRAETEPPASSETPFIDVPHDHPFLESIAWAAEQGVTTGFGDGTFRPQGPVTRQAMAAFLDRC